jgi:hypothetical protein
MKEEDSITSPTSTKDKSSAFSTKKYSIRSSSSQVQQTELSKFGISILNPKILCKL